MSDRNIKGMKWEKGKRYEEGYMERSGCEMKEKNEKGEIKKGGSSER